MIEKQSMKIHEKPMRLLLTVRFRDVGDFTWPAPATRTMCHPSSQIVPRSETSKAQAFRGVWGIKNHPVVINQRLNRHFEKVVVFFKKTHILIHQLQIPKHINNLELSNIKTKFLLNVVTFIFRKALLCFFQENVSPVAPYPRCVPHDCPVNSVFCPATDYYALQSDSLCRPPAPQRSGIALRVRHWSPVSHSPSISRVLWHVGEPSWSSGGDVRARSSK